MQFPECIFLDHFEQNIDPPGFIAVSVYEDDGAVCGLLSFGEPGIRSDGNESELPDRLDGFLIGDESGKTEEDRRDDAPLQQGLFQFQRIGFQVVARREDKVVFQRFAGMIRMRIGVVAPGDDELPFFFPAA